MIGTLPEAMHDGWTIRRYGAVDSTQIVATGLIADRAPHRTVVVAERQTAGYGRKGDVWRDLPGACLLMTVIVRPRYPASLPRYAMIAALASIEAIGATTGLPATLKWPNDVLLNGHKVAGILGDANWQGARLEALRLGVGINIAGDRALFLARDLPDATSLAAEAGHAIDREHVLASWLAAFARLEDRFIAGHEAEIVAAWRASLATIGRRVVATRTDGSAVSGVATDVTDDGDLIVTTDKGDNVCLRATGIRSLRHRECGD
jgi:BirA family transcriptional regulator, biotin operon repressor / biotin---[acetyl-CoA-carboxylase] ligase